VTLSARFESVVPPEARGQPPWPRSGKGEGERGWIQRAGICYRHTKHVGTDALGSKPFRERSQQVSQHGGDEQFIETSSMRGGECEDGRQ
jgi:hypothetical protein